MSIKGTYDNVNNIVHITVDSKMFDDAWSSEEEFVKFIEDIAIEATIKCGYAKDKQEAIRILGYSRSTDGKE